MRGAVFPALFLTGCSLVVSLDGYTSSAQPGGPDASTVADGGTDAGADARVADAGPSGPIAVFDFDEGQGVTSQDSVGSRIASLEGAVTWTDGFRGKALAFSGGDARSTALDSPAFPRNGTVALRINNDFGVSSQSGRNFFERWATGTNGHFFVRHVGTQFQVGFMAKAFVDQYAYEWSLPSPPNKTWFHVAVSWSSDAHRAAVYVDGVLKDSGPIDPQWTMAQERFIVGDTCVCAIDDVRLWDRVLEDAEVAKLP